MIRLVALDLDGTLLNRNFQMSDADEEACRQAITSGVSIVLNTSRWYKLAERTARKLELRTPLVCHNGAHIQEPNDGRELLHERIPVEAARAIAAFCDEAGIETYTSVDGMTYMRPREELQVDPARLPKDMRLANTHAEHVTSPATGIIAFSAEGVRAVVDAFAERYPDLLFSEAWGETSTPYVTITAGSVDKGTALRLVCEQLGMPLDEVMAVGDATPDLAMFETAELGVAMGNAPESVKAEADAVAPSNEESGVSWAIRRFVLEEA